MFYYNSECYKTSDTSYTIAFYTFKNDGSNLFPISALSYIVTPTSVSLDRSYNLGLTTSGSGYGLLSDDGNYRTLKTINGQDIFGSGDITIGGDASASPFYITEFTLDNLRSSSFEQEYYPCDAAAVCAALDEGKIILVPVWDGATGYVVAKVYYEDLLYWTIYDESLLQVFTFDMVTTDTDIVSTNVSTSVLATQSYVDDAVANSDYTITSFTKATLDNANNTENVNAITISATDYNAIKANNKTIYLNNGGSGGRCILSGWNVISSTLARLEFLCDGLTYVCDVTISGSTAKITLVRKIGNMRNVTHSSLTIYANETYYWNDSSYADVTFSLQTPTNTNITNVFTIIIKNTTHNETSISFYTPNNTIVWANDNPPVLGGSSGDTYGNYTEISIRYVDGKYLGTWTKFSAS